MEIFFFFFIFISRKFHAKQIVFKTFILTKPESLGRRKLFSARLELKANFISVKLATKSEKPSELFHSDVKCVAL